MTRQRPSPLILVSPPQSQSVAPHQGASHRGTPGKEAECGGLSSPGRWTLRISLSEQAGAAWPWPAGALSCRTSWAPELAGPAPAPVQPSSPPAAPVTVIVLIGKLRETGSRDMRFVSFRLGAQPARGSQDITESGRIWKFPFSISPPPASAPNQWDLSPNPHGARVPNRMGECVQQMMETGARW